jgi:hypothetical protein
MLDHDFRDKNSSSSSTNNWYETLIEEEIVHEWRERNHIRCVPFNGTWLLFAGCDM